MLYQSFEYEVYINTLFKNLQITMLILTVSKTIIYYLK